MDGWTYMFVLRDGDQYAAIIITAKTSDNGALYEWYSGIDESGRFLGDTVQHGTGKVYERFIKRGDMLIMYGGQIDIIADSFKVKWSQDEWVYLTNTSYSLAITDAEDIKAVNALSPDLEWHKASRKGEDAVVNRE